MALPDPLDPTLQGWRYLTDTGIRQALAAGAISITPDRGVAGRIQPATIDVCIEGIDELGHIDEELPTLEARARAGKIAIPGRAAARIRLTELLEPGRGYEQLLGFLYEGRSSVRRFGMYNPHAGLDWRFEGRSNIDLWNWSDNDIYFDPGERVSQAFVRVFPYADKTYLDDPGTSEGDLVRSLDMGIRIERDEDLQTLLDEKLLEIDGPILHRVDGMFAVHASDEAYRFRRLRGGIDFTRREEIDKHDALEPIDIRGGHKVRKHEHIIVETLQGFRLSEYVGIHFLDSPIGLSQYMRHTQSLPIPHENSHLNSLWDGWVDPGYEGGFSRQPKWMSGREIFPFDVLGWASVVYYPNGTSKLYGDPSLDSQYQGKTRTEFSA